MNIAVVGIGYVGLANAILLAQQNKVTLLDIDASKVAMINQYRSPIEDPEIEDYLENKPLQLTATTDEQFAYRNADFIIIAAPTDYDCESRTFDTTIVDAVIASAIRINPSATLVIKSTVPVNFTYQARERFQYPNILFSPEFLREGQALYDCLYPSRIIVGGQSEAAKVFGALLQQCTAAPNPPVIYTHSCEAESIKLFANTFLAMRVAFFNELDTYAEINHLSSRDIIEGVCLDSRIGQYYNNPSFGYGGYCLPKDTKQLYANFENIPNRMIAGIVEANSVRKEHVVNAILANEPEVVGVYRLITKVGSDNFRSSAILDVIDRLIARGVRVVIFEPKLSQVVFHQCEVIHQLAEFKRVASIIVANRLSQELADVRQKVYSRDIYQTD
ncbi:nucleotide sugar dehydrogenase [Vibrio sp. TRT 1302]|uniref:nucleotide sugar dehydrogenase n=1 Tax=Vibrio sp. TRT 1302 TaxID=3418504 RepID=UPI003CE676B1